VILLHGGTSFISIAEVCGITLYVGGATRDFSLRLEMTVWWVAQLNGSNQSALAGFVG
jgi:hypothetical protein